MYTSCFRHLYLADNVLPPWGSNPTVAKKPMSTPFQGASGPSGHAGFGTALGQPTVGRNHATPEPVVISLQQILPKEKPIYLQLRRLTVRFLADVSNLRANELFGGTRNPLKHCWHGTRYNPVPLTKYSPDRSEGVVCDKGTDRRFIEIAR